jgi:hypothetical protein
MQLAEGKADLDAIPKTSENKPVAKAQPKPAAKKATAAD